MDSADISKSIIIVCIFLGINFAILLSIGLKGIKKEWPKYRCNPLVIPFATFFGKDPISNFESCIQNIQNVHMESILDPVYHSFTSISNVGNEITNSVVGFSGIINVLKSNLGSVVSLAVDIVINIIIELQSIIIKIKDMINKLIGIFISFIYLIAGSQSTALTIWNGLPGWLLKKIANFKDKSQDKDKK
jgi:hypothetical protein